MLCAPRKKAHTLCASHQGHTPCAPHPATCCRSTEENEHRALALDDEDCLMGICQRKSAERTKEEVRFVWDGLGMHTQRCGAHTCIAWRVMRCKQCVCLQQPSAFESGWHYRSKHFGYLKTIKSTSQMCRRPSTCRNQSLSLCLRQWQLAWLDGHLITTAPAPSSAPCLPCCPAGACAAAGNGSARAARGGHGAWSAAHKGLFPAAWSGE
eukprot:361505-Chlamydomonas_euryale.AAC.3